MMEFIRWLIFIKTVSQIVIKKKKFKKIVIIEKDCDKKIVIKKIVIIKNDCDKKDCYKKDCGN